MVTFNLREIYKKGLHRFDLGPSAQHLLMRLSAGDDSAQDYEDAAKIDRLFTTQIVRAGVKASKLTFPANLSHCAVLIGEDNTRDFILGHSIRRSIDPTADAQFTSFASSKAVLRRSIEAERKADEIGNPHTQLAYCVGLLFDCLEQWILSEAKLAQNFSGLFEKTWRHSMKTAELAWDLSQQQRLSSKWNRWLFAGSLAHDIGKLLMCYMYPEQYVQFLAQLDKRRQDSPLDEAQEQVFERENFGVAHPEIGSLLMSFSRYLSELEELVDFHHDCLHLKERSPDTYAALSVVNLADQLVFMSESPSGLNDQTVAEVLESHREAYDYKAGDTSKVLVTLRAKKLLV